MIRATLGLYPYYGMMLTTLFLALLLLSSSHIVASSPTVTARGIIWYRQYGVQCLRARTHTRLSNPAAAVS